MGYTTDFDGVIKIVPPLNRDERNYLQQFSETRRMQRKRGPYFVDGTGSFGQGFDPDIVDYNRPPDGQPELWCKWVPTYKGGGLEWNGGEKFYSAPEWMTYIIDHFLKPGCLAQRELPFLQGNHTCNGIIYAQGEDPNDRWSLVVENNVVRVQRAVIHYED